MFLEIKNPNPIDYSKFNNRKSGISGFMRIKNEEQFIETVVLSWINYLDELVIIYNDCNDKTPIILKRLEKKYPKKIKLFHYLPVVYPFNTPKFSKTDIDSIHSFCFYSNFALSKTSYDKCVKIDGDHIGIPQALKRIYNYLTEKNMKDSVYYFSAFNLWMFNRRLYFDLNNPYCGNGDVYYFNSSDKHKFIKHPLNKNLEFLRISSKYQYDIGFIFLHTHYMKKTFLKNFKKTNESWIPYTHNNIKKVNCNFYISKILDNGKYIRYMVPKHKELYFNATGKDLKDLQ